MEITDEKRKAMADYLAGPLNRFMSAAEKGDIKTMKAALGEVASVDVHEPWYGRTALHCAAHSGSIEAIEFLVAAGAALNALDGNEMTPLMCACLTGRTKGSKAALVLLHHGADALYVRENDGMNAIKFALWGRCTRSVLKELLARGATPPEAEFQMVHLVGQASRVSAIRRWALWLFVIIGLAALWLVFLEIRKSTGG